MRSPCSNDTEEANARNAGLFKSQPLYMHDQQLTTGDYRILYILMMSMVNQLTECLTSDEIFDYPSG